jgi:hypothetical protein
MAAMNLPQYISKVGEEAFAAKFDISVRAANSYRLEQRLPRPKLAARIIAETPVSWGGIYGNAGKASAN